MNVNTATSHAYMSQRIQTPVAKNDAASFSATMAAATTEKTPPEDAVVKKADFTNMTRQEMRDWINDQLDSGAMSFEDSVNLVVLTFFAHSEGDQAVVDSIVKKERVNFFDITQNIIDFSRSEGDHAAVERYQKTLSFLQQVQSQAIRLDAKV